MRCVLDHMSQNVLLAPRCDDAVQEAVTEVMYTADLSVGDLDNPLIDADDEMDMDGTATLRALHPDLH